MRLSAAAIARQEPLDEKAAESATVAAGAMAAAAVLLARQDATGITGTVQESAPHGFAPCFVCRAGRTSSSPRPRNLQRLGRADAAFPGEVNTVMARNQWWTQHNASFYIALSTRHVLPRVLSAQDSPGVATAGVRIRFSYIGDWLRPLGSAVYGVDNALVARTPAEFAGQAFPDLVLGWLRIVGKQRGDRHGETRCAEPALQSMALS